MHQRNGRFPAFLQLLAGRPGWTATGLLAGLLCLTALAEADDATEDNDSPEVEAVRPIPEPAEQVDDILDERESSSSSPVEDDYPDVPGCAPLAGDREALPLADRAHRAISEALCEPADQVERQLSDQENGTGSAPEALEDDNTDNGTEAEGEAATDSMATPRTGTTLLRLSSSLDWRYGDRVQPGVGLSASVRLARLYRRVNRTAERGTEAVQMDEVIPEESTSATPAWYLSPLVFVMDHTDIGLRGWYPFIRLRTPARYEWDSGAALRFRPEVFWRSDDGTGIGGSLRLTYPHDQDNRWLFNNQMELDQTSARNGDGIGWSQQLSYRHYLADRFVITGRVDHSGRSEPRWQTDQVRSDLRLRRSIGRPWLSAELEPYALWENGTGFELTPGIILRLEVEFGDYDLYED